MDRLYDILRFFRLLIGGIAGLVGINPEIIKFDSLFISYALGASILLMFLVRLLTLIYGRYKFYRKYSGHFIFSTYPYRVRLGEKVFRSTAVCLIIVPLTAFLAALAGAYKDVDNTEYVQSEFRQQMVLFDNSVSVGWESNEPKKAWAEIIRDGYGELLDMRVGKNDRTSIWIFSRTPYLISDFVTSVDYLRNKAFKAPYILIDPESVYLPGAGKNLFYPVPEVILPEEKMMKIPYEGGTNLALALREMVKYLDRNEDDKYKHTTFIVVTDGAPDNPVEAELELLRRRKIKLLVLYMYNSTYDRFVGRPDGFGMEAARKIENAKKFKLDVVKYGGEFYQAADKSELRRMYKRIDEQEAVSYKIKIHKSREDYSDDFLRFGVSTLFFVVLMGLLIFLRRGISP